MSSPNKSGGKAGRRARNAIFLPALKAPRNPVVRALVERTAAQGAGRHQRSEKAERRAEKIGLRKSV